MSKDKRDYRHRHQAYFPHNENAIPPEHPLSKRWKPVYWIVGIGSLIWLLLRSGTKPRRLAYPCQRVAATNSVGFLAYLVALLSSATLLRRLKAAFSLSRLTVFVVGLLLVAVLQSSVATPLVPARAESPDLPSWTSPTAVSDVFVVTNVPAPAYSLNGGILPDNDALHDDGVDALVNLMETHGDYFYQTTAHLDGLFAADDVIVVKVNNQWDGRNGTNSDVVKGVIYRLVQHPDGFTGAVIVAENTQTHNTDWYSEPSGNNSQFMDQSYQEVVQVFADEGYNVCIADWRSIRTNFVNDYDDGDSTSGYVLDAGDRKLSYPKFQIDCNGASFQISMRYGLWNGASFDNTRLKMINLPVLKRHNAAWATIAVKNYLGFITTENDGMGRWSDAAEIHCWLTGPSDNGYSCSTDNTTYGLIGRQMAHIRRADLDIVDAIWVNPRNNSDWHGEAQRLDVLLASRDPFAVDYYASDYILGPLIQQQYGSSSGYEQAMASTTGGWFRNIQRYNVARLRTEGVTDTINMDDSMTTQEELDQFNVYVADANMPMAPTLTLLQPNGGETWLIGTQEQITWSSTNLAGDVTLEYSTNGFASSTIIAASTDNNGAYTWTIPDDPSDTVLVRVSSTLTATISDTSNTAFTITPMPTLTLQAPNGGETWTVDTEQQITWASSGNVGDLALEYSTDGFVSSTSIDVSTVDDGSYTWTIPDDPSDNVLVRVSSNLYSTISDTSDAIFTIVPVPLTPTLTVESPNGGEVWTINTQRQIEWTSTNLEGDVALEYSTDGFASSTVISGFTTNDGVYDWTVPVDLSTNVLVRVSSVVSNTISDTSNSTFTIAGPYTFDDSYKTASHRNLEGGERMTYTIVLYEAISATLTLTDVIPAPVSYVPGSATVEPSGSGSLQLPGTSLRWSGVVTGAVPVTITFQVGVPDVGTLVVLITNCALVSRNGAPSEELVATSLINGFHVYLPVVFRSN